MGDPVTDDYGRRCLLARRLVENGVRVVVVVSGGASTQWDAHDDIEENHLRMAAHTDKPIAGLLKDLKQRGLLDSTLVVWGGSSAARRKGKPARGAITTTRGSRCGWPAGLGRNGRRGYRRHRPEGG